MARSHAGMPRPKALEIKKSGLLESLATLDADQDAVNRVLKMETDFRRRISAHVESLPLESALFAKFNTNPFVLLFHTFKKSYRHVYEIEQDILPAKLFSSMETSAGRMVETVVLPIYGWECVASGMHSAESVLDGRQPGSDPFRVATLKSGPRCLNDEMSENIADAIIAHARGWARQAGTTQVDFTYGVLYGTKKQSNKKDWHILRNIGEKLPQAAVIVRPDGRWDCTFVKEKVTVRVAVRIGIELWNHLADNGLAFLEMACALIRACVSPSDTEPEDCAFTIRDLNSIISLDVVPDDFNVSILQHSQLEWLFFFARHFCDSIANE